VHEPYDIAQTLVCTRGILLREAMKMERKDYNRDAVDVVKRAIGVVIDPLSDNKKDAIEPGSEGGLRRQSTAVKKIPTKKRKRTPLL